MQNPWKDIAAALDRILQAHGFRRTRQVLINQENPEVIRTLTIIKYRWNTSGDRRFQLELSIYLASGTAGEFSFPKRDSRYSLVFRKSAGYLWGDEMFQYAVPDTPGPDFYERIRGDAERYVIPFFEQCASVESVTRTLEGEERKAGTHTFSALLAIALARLGRTDESRRFFQQIPGDPETVRRMAAQYGVSL